MNTLNWYYKWQMEKSIIYSPYTYRIDRARWNAWIERKKTVGASEQEQEKAGTEGSWSYTDQIQLFVLLFCWAMDKMYACPRFIGITNDERFFVFSFPRFLRYRCFRTFFGRRCLCLEFVFFSFLFHFGILKCGRHHDRDCIFSGLINKSFIKH